MGNSISHLWRPNSKRRRAVENSRTSTQRQPESMVDQHHPQGQRTSRAENIPPRRSGDDNTARSRSEDDSMARRRSGDDSTARRRSGDDSTARRRSGDDSTAQRRGGDDNTVRRRSGDDNILPSRRSGDDITPRSVDDKSPTLSMEDIVFPLEDETLRNDPDMVNFDDGMKQCTEKVLDSLEQGIKSGGLEISTLKDVTNGLMEMEQDVAKFILDCDLDVWANHEMKELVTQYFDQSLEALDFCGVLENSVQHVRDNQMIIESAIRYMPDNRDPDEDECQKILHELDLFVQAENPFSSEFAKLFTQVYNHQQQLQKKLTERKRRIHRRDRNFRMVRKITNVILTASCASLVICAAVAMAVAAPVVPGLSVSAAAALPFEIMHSWLRSLWSNYEQKIKVDREVVEDTNWGTWATIKDLDTINTEVRRLNGEIEGIIRNIQFGQERGDSLAVQQSVRAIKRKQEQFVQQLEDLNVHVDVCVRRINTARARVLERILGQSDRG